MAFGRRWLPALLGDDKVYYRASDPTNAWTHTQAEQEAALMKVVGTGKDPLGRYPENIYVDIPEDASHKTLLDMGFVKEIDPKEHPGRTEWQIANSVVRNDPLSEPVEREIAAEIGDRAHAIVHTGNVEAKAEEAFPELEESDENAPPGGRSDHDETTHWDEAGGFDATRGRRSGTAAAKAEK